MSLSLIDGTHLIDWPVSEDCFAVDILFGDETPHTAVVGLIAMIAQDVVVTGFDIDRRVTSPIEEIGRHVVLIEYCPIHEDVAFLDVNDITRQTDNTLDI